MPIAAALLLLRPAAVCNQSGCWTACREQVLTQSKLTRRAVPIQAVPMKGTHGVQTWRFVRISPWTLSTMKPAPQHSPRLQCEVWPRVGSAHARGQCMAPLSTLLPALPQTWLCAHALPAGSLACCVRRACTLCVERPCLGDSVVRVQAGPWCCMSMMCLADSHQHGNRRKATQRCKTLSLLQDHNAWHNPVQRLFPVIAVDHGRRRGAHGLILGHRRAAFHDERQCWCKELAQPLHQMQK